MNAPRVQAEPTAVDEMSDELALSGSAEHPDMLPLEFVHALGERNDFSGPASLP